MSTAALGGAACIISCLTYVYLAPDVYMLLPVFGTFIAVACSPYLRLRTLKMFMIGTWGALCVAMALAHSAARQALPGWFLIACAAVALAITFALLMHFNGRMYETLLAAWRADRQQTFLADAGESLAESLDLQATFATAARLAVPFLGDGCVIDVLNNDGKLERMTLHYVGDATSIPLSNVRLFTPDLEGNPEHPVVRAIKSGRSVLLTNPEAIAQVVVSEAHYEFIKRMDIRSMMAVPFGAAEQQATRLDALISALLEVNRVTAKAAVLQNRVFDLREVIRELVDRFNEEAARVGSTLELEATKEVWGEWDMVRLDQVITNLMTNAIKYGAGAPIDVKLTSDSQNAYVSVADRGIGIAAEDQKRIFDRFERAVSTRNYGGFGLGLWVARTLVNAAGGEIAVVSKPKEGAVFTVTLPRNVPGLVCTGVDRPAAVSLP